MLQRSKATLLFKSSVFDEILNTLEPLEVRVLLSATVELAADSLANIAAAPLADMVPDVTNTKPTGLTPTQISQAYGFNQVKFTNAAGQTVAGNGTGETIAIVDAYADPNIASDLKTFDAAFGLSNNDGTGVSALTVYAMASKISSDAGWALETSLDVEWAHAIAPGAHILLVEAKSSSLTDLLAAVDYARKQAGVVTVSMSWGSSEFSTEKSYDTYFTTPAGHAGVTFVASSGDSGAPAIWPAVSPNVVAVGGTTLSLSSGAYSSESAWSGSGGGISLYEAKPSYQATVTQSTTKRTDPDVAYDANPSSGFSVYDSVTYSRQSGWFTVGGTSAGAPQWAALIAIADQGRALAGLGSLDGATGTLPALYNAPASDFHDITTGSNNKYSASAGYDLVTGRGTPLANLIIPALVGATAKVQVAATQAVLVTPADEALTASGWGWMGQLNDASAAPILTTVSQSALVAEVEGDAAFGIPAAGLSQVFAPVAQKANVSAATSPAAPADSTAGSSTPADDILPRFKVHMLMMVI